MHMSCGVWGMAKLKRGRAKEMERRKKMYAVAGLGLCIMLAAGTAGRHFMAASAKEAEYAYRETALCHGDLQMTFTGEGVTAAQTILQEADFDVSATEFVVEKTYAASADEVKKGDALYKLSDESVAEAAAYYEEAVAKALKASSNAKTAYESGKAEAEYEREKSKAEAKSATETCDAALLALEDGVVTAAQDGILSGTLYEAGDTLTDGMAVAQYLNQDIMTVAVEVSQDNIAKISVGDKAEVSIAGMPMENLEGEIRYIATSATAERSMSN